MKDYYQVLGVQKSASKDEIKKSYRKLAHEFHPDKHQDDEQRKNAEVRFKEVNEAYQVLSNDKKRQQYDTFGSAGVGGPGGAPGGGGFSGFEGFDFNGGAGGFDVGDIFEGIFGGSGGRRQQRQKRGNDISIDIEIDFKESIFGVEKSITVRKRSDCEKCKGSGADDPSKVKSCKECSGSGSVRRAQRTILGIIEQVIECPDCNGRGKVPEKKCNTCRGEGILPKNEEIKIVVPPGIRTGEVIQIPGKGEGISGGVPGDAFVRVRVRPSEKFAREGNDVHTVLSIPLSQALVGGNQKVETLDGTSTISIPAGTNNNAKLRIRGKGVVHGRGSSGDLIINVQVEMPKKTNKHIQAIAKELESQGF